MPRCRRVCIPSIIGAAPVTLFVGWHHSFTYGTVRLFRFSLDVRWSGLHSYMAHQSEMALLFALVSACVCHCDDDSARGSSWRRRVCDPPSGHAICGYCLQGHRSINPDVVFVYAVLPLLMVWAAVGLIFSLKEVFLS
jgi:hypothetical protein